MAMNSKNSFKVDGNLEAGNANPSLERYATRLRALDKDGNGVIDMNEVCMAIDQMVEQEKQTRLMKKLTMVFGILSLLTVAAVVGLTYAVVVLSKDVENNNNVLVSKDSGLPMATSQYTTATYFYQIVANPTPENLAKVKNLVTPGDTPEDNFTMHTVETVTVKNDGSVVFYLTGGEAAVYTADKSTGEVSVSYIDTTATGTGTRRRLQADSTGTNINGEAIDNASWKAEPINQAYCASLSKYQTFACDVRCGCLLIFDPPILIDDPPVV